MEGENYDDENYDDLLDEAQDELDEGQDLKEAQLDSYGTYPEQKAQDNLYHWFWKVVRLKKAFQLAKVANLSKEEIGLARTSVRDAMNLWVLGHTFNHGTFGNYFANMAKITSVTSMAKNGWFMDLSISQKKVRERTKKPSRYESWKFRKKPERIDEA